MNEQQKKEQRRAAYESKHNKLLSVCETCRKTQHPTLEHCNNGCTNGNRLRWLETEYSDVTGWSHEQWSSK